jgi:hypothetical protein
MSKKNRNRRSGGGSKDGLLPLIVEAVVVPIIEMIVGAIGERKKRKLEDSKEVKDDEAS